MGIFDFLGNEKDLHDQVRRPPDSRLLVSYCLTSTLQYHSGHTASITGETLTGAATYAAIHKYESDQRAKGEPVTHAGLKEAG